MCSVCTVEANDFMQENPHDPMPAILKREDYDNWLAPGTDTNTLLSMLNTTPTNLMQSHEVDVAVNKGEDGLHCAQRCQGESQVHIFCSVAFATHVFSQLLQFSLRPTRPVGIIGRIIE